MLVPAMAAQTSGGGSPDIDVGLGREKLKHSSHNEPELPMAAHGNEPVGNRRLTPGPLCFAAVKTHAAAKVSGLFDSNVQRRVLTHSPYPVRALVSATTAPH